MAHLPVSIFSLCELNQSLVLFTLYISHTSEWYMRCTENIGFNSLFTTDLDESEVATHSLIIMLFEISSTGFLSKASIGVHWRLEIVCHLNSLLTW